MLNKVELIGHLGQDPEFSNLNDDRQVCNFTLATTEKWKDKTTGEKKEKTEWHRIACFNQGLNKVIREYVKKGSKVYLSGKLVTRKWQDKDGSDRYTTEINMNVDCKLIMLDGRKRDKGGDYNPEEIPNDDSEVVPF